MSDYIFRNRFASLSRCQPRWWGIVLNSGHEEHRPYLSIIGFRRFLSINMPKWIIQPRRVKVQAGWDAATVARIGRDWYWNETRREFGITFYEDRISIEYGVQPDCWPGDKRVSWQLPWTRWTPIENRWLDLNGAAFESVPDHFDYEARQAAKDRAPALRCGFKDFDGEEIEATVRIEEFVHARGAGRWAWLSYFLRPRVGRRYDIEFTRETGPRKGSWKGGTNAVNGPAQPGELHAQAFQRYAAEERFSEVRALPLGVTPCHTEQRKGAK
jgi:hypothetical protein